MYIAKFIIIAVTLALRAIPIVFPIALERYIVPCLLMLVSTKPLRAKGYGNSGVKD